MTTPLAALERQAAADLDYLDYPMRSWVVQKSHEQGLKVHDVVIAGGGINGLAAAFGLLRERITNIAVFDRGEEGFEGPWLTFARMRGLRTHKNLVGPDLGLPSLSFPAWYRAAFGNDAWTALDKATNREWMDYLRWFRRVAGIPMQNGVEVTNVRPDGEFLRVEIKEGGEIRQIAARRVVLAGGVLSAGGPEIPAFISAALPSNRWAHSSDSIDFSRLQGKRVAVLGAGASAFDNAAVALEHGAAQVHLFARRTSIEQASGKGALEFSGFLRHFGDLPDDAKWRIIRRLATFSVPPPPSSVERCERHSGFRVSTSCPWNDVRLQDDEIRVDTPQGPFSFDFAILATGFAVDLSRRSELSEIADDIALWSDVYAPPPGERPEMAERLGRHPYLGASYQLLPKPGRNAPWLAHIHDFGLASIQSLGPITVGLNGMKYGPLRLIQGISRSLFLEDAALHEAAFEKGNLPAELVI